MIVLFLIYVFKQLVEKNLIKVYQIKKIKNVALTRGGLHVARAGQHIHYVGKLPHVYVMVNFRWFKIIRSNMFVSYVNKFLAFFSYKQFCT